MNSFRPNRPRKRLFIAALLVLVVYGVGFFSAGSLRAFLRDAGYIAWKAGSSFGAAFSGSGYLSVRRALMEENASLREQISRLEEKGAAYQVLVEENRSLREMTHIAELEGGVTAPITSSFRASPYGTFMIGAGSSDGILPGDIVLSSESFVIGRVEETSEDSALVRELFASGVSTDALLSNTGITIEGRGGGNARASLPREVSISVGDPVISPIFRGRAIGIVGAVEENQSRGEKVVYIRLPLNLSALKFVYIVKR